MFLANVTVLGLVSGNHNLPLFAQSRRVIPPDISLLNSRLSRSLFPAIFSTTSRLNSAIRNSKFKNYLAPVICISKEYKFINIIERTKITTGQKFFKASTSITIQQCYFLECFVRHSPTFGANGGAIFADVMSDFTATVIECGFKNCFSEDKAGGVFIKNGKILTKGCIFTQNMAFEGPNLYALSASTTIEHCLIKQTKFYKTDSIGHSGMSFTDSTTSIAHSNITNVNHHVTKASAINIVRARSFSLTYTKLKKLNCITALDFIDSSSDSVQISNILFLAINASQSILSTTRAVTPIIVRSSDFRAIGTSMLFDESVEFIDCVRTKGKLVWNLPNGMKNISGFVKDAQAPVIVAEQNPYNLKNCWMNEKVKPTKRFTQSCVFTPTEAFTPSMTYSGIRFEKDGMNWEEFKRSTKAVKRIDTKAFLRRFCMYLNNICIYGHELGIVRRTSHVLVGELKQICHTRPVL